MLCPIIINFYVRKYFVSEKYFPHHDPNNSKFPILVDFILVYFSINLILTQLISSLVIYLFNNAPMFPCYLLPDSSPLLIKVPLCFLYPCYVAFLLFSNSLVIILTCFAYGIFFVPFVVRELRVDRKSYKSVPELRQPSGLMPAYRSSQILQNQVNGLMGYFILPSQTMVTQIILLNTFTLITQSQHMSIPTLALMCVWTLTVAVFWSVILLMGGYLHFYGVKILTSWKYHAWPTKRDKKLMSKFRKSCPPIQVNFQKAYVIKRLTVLKFIRGLSRGILRILLTLKK